MNTQDRWIIISLVGIIILHIAVWLVGYFTNRLVRLISFVNLAVVLSILAYWIINELHVRQHYIEQREIAVLIFAIIIAASSLYKIFYNGHTKWLTILQYIFFGIDLTILIAALLFMLTFKITRLF